MLYVIYPQKLGKINDQIMENRAKYPILICYNTSVDYDFLICVCSWAFTKFSLVYFLCFIAKFNLITNRTVPQFSYEHKKAGRFWFLIYSDGLHKGNWHVLFSNFPVYQLQQEAPHPRRITCTNEVGVTKPLQRNVSQSFVSQTLTFLSDMVICGINFWCYLAS